MIETNAVVSGFSRTDAPLARTVAEWAALVRYEDLPADVIDSTKLRILDVIGLCLAGGVTPFGRSTRAAAVALSPPGAAHIFGSGEPVGPTFAAFANAACSQALEYDDTHNESIVHMSSPAVTAGLAIAETRPVTGRELIAAIAVANEISCRVGCVAAGEFHRRGFHPTGLFAPFGVTCLAGRLLALDAGTMSRAAGICGSFASGLLECWVDGTQAKFLHSGWAAQSGIAAATLARSGITGPPAILEGRFGLFASHLQDPAAPKDLSRATEALGSRWESRNSSFKPYPAAHVLHPYIDALLRAREQHALTPADVRRIDCPVAAFIVPIVCEPVAEKVAPATDAHGRVSLQYTLAEALHLGRLGRTAYEQYRNPEILDLAKRVHYHIDPAYPGPGRFKGEVRISLRDGRVITDVQEYNRGSAENPMTRDELRAKYDDNAGVLLSGPARDRLAAGIDRLETLADTGTLVRLTVAG